MGVEVVQYHDHAVLPALLRWLGTSPPDAASTSAAPVVLEKVGSLPTDLGGTDRPRTTPKGAPPGAGAPSTTLGTPAGGGRPDPVPPPGAGSAPAPPKEVP